MRVDRKGQVNNIVSAMVLVLIVGFIGIISITIYDSIDDSMTSALSSSTGDAAQTLGNFSGAVYDGYDLVSNVPLVLAAALLLSVIIGLAVVLR